MREMMKVSERASEMGQFPKLKKQNIIAIIAMKGRPYTKREDTGKRIAKWASIPIFQIEDSLDALSLERGYASDNPPSAEEATRLQRTAFDVVCRIAGTQLSKDIQNNCVLISSPLSFRFQLDRLIQMASSVGGVNPPRVLIIECERKNKFRWQNAAEKEVLSSRSRRWYEPSGWKDVFKSPSQYGDEEWDDYYGQKVVVAPPNKSGSVIVKRLVLDPVEDLNRSEFVKNEKQNRRSLFAEVVKDLILGDDVGEDAGRVEYRLWRRKRLEKDPTFIFDAPREGSCSPGYCVFDLIQLQTDASVHDHPCGVCGDQVANNVYYCHFCSLSFHESCATETAHISHVYSHQEKCSRRKRYGFPETHACDTCAKQNKGFSYRCAYCIFRTHLKCRVVPTIVKHVGHEHALSIRLLCTQREKREYDCKACWRKGYINSYACNVCGSDYHMECIRRPLEIMEHQHGGHLHRVKLEFSCDKDEEYEWCLACYQDIDPETWVYKCLECDYVTHIYCI